jgi:2-polyprenyl-6-hydroxyphenyl methylase/3-demethylubiquinone-9 3-methyltransferase
MNISGYRYEGAECSHTYAYLLPTVFEVLAGVAHRESGLKVFDLCCGNGSTAHALVQAGYRVVGVDPSETGIAQARRNFPHLALEVGSTEIDLAATYGHFAVVLSLEVVEHVFAPREYAQRVFDLLESGGFAVISTPYHGYLKNVALAVSGKMDAHFTALWDYGHIKFRSIKTLEQLLRETGFEDIKFHRVGRLPPMVKSMIAVARKPL